MAPAAPFFNKLRDDPPGHGGNETAVYRFGQLSAVLIASP